MLFQMRSQNIWTSRNRVLEFSLESLNVLSLATNSKKSQKQLLKDPVILLIRRKQISIATNSKFQNWQGVVIKNENYHLPAVKYQRKYKQILVDNGRVCIDIHLLNFTCRKKESLLSKNLHTQSRFICSERGLQTIGCTEQAGTSVEYNFHFEIGLKSNWKCDQPKETFKNERWEKGSNAESSNKLTIQLWTCMLHFLLKYSNFLLLSLIANKGMSSS